MTEYMFKQYTRGKVSYESKPMNLKEAQQFYMNNYSPETALRLFVDGEQVPYLNTAKILQLTKAQYLNTVKPLLPHTVRG